MDNNQVSKQEFKNAIFECINREDIEGLEKLIPRNQWKTYQVDDHGNGLLNLACLWGRDTLVQPLIATGINVNQASSPSHHPLYLALTNEDFGIAELLVKAGADTHIQLAFGSSPLHCAIKNRQMKLAFSLIEAGADVNASNASGETPLHLSAALGDIELAKTLIVHQADVLAIDKWGRSFWDFCRETSFKKAIQIFLEREKLMNSSNKELNNKIKVQQKTLLTL